MSGRALAWTFAWAQAMTHRANTAERRATKLFRSGRTIRPRISCRRNSGDRYDCARKMLGPGLWTGATVTANRTLTGRKVLQLLPDKLSTA
jgi:hypothetical protein